MPGYNHDTLDPFEAVLENATAHFDVDGNLAAPMQPGMINPRVRAIEAVQGRVLMVDWETQEISPAFLDAVEYEMTRDYFRWANMLLDSIGAGLKESVEKVESPEDGELYTLDVLPSLVIRPFFDELGKLSAVELLPTKEEPEGEIVAAEKSFFIIYSASENDEFDRPHILSSEPQAVIANPSPDQTERLYTVDMLFEEELERMQFEDIFRPPQP